MNYLSIQDATIHEIEIKKSRFICYLFPIRTPEEATEHLAVLRKEHYKANHCCYAYILNEQSSVQRMSDDGEPAGTAGIPMLEVLKQQELTYILAVVVRYFGGTKLGAGGLIRAYSHAVSEALNHAQLVQNVLQITGKISLSYAQVDSFNYYIQQTTLPVHILDTHYTDTVSFNFAIQTEYLAIFEMELTDRFNGQLLFEVLGEQTLNIPYTHK